ncbi:MAG: hypothetical protein QM680_07425 [Luteolibacter sp.]
MVVRSAPLSWSAALSRYHDLLKAGGAEVNVSLTQMTDQWGGEQESSGGGVTVYNSYPKNPLLLVSDEEGNELLSAGVESEGNDGTTPTYSEGADGVNLADYPYFLTKGEPKDWWEKDGIPAKPPRGQSVSRRTPPTARSRSRPPEPPAPPSTGSPKSRRWSWLSGVNLVFLPGL